VIVAIVKEEEQECNIFKNDKSTSLDKESREYLMNLQKIAIKVHLHAVNGKYL
jgi:hypothetical protein